MTIMPTVRQHIADTRRLYSISPDHETWLLAQTSLEQAWANYNNIRWMTNYLYRVGWPGGNQLHNWIALSMRIIEDTDLLDANVMPANGASAVALSHVSSWLHMMNNTPSQSGHMYHNGVLKNITSDYRVVNENAYSMCMNMIAALMPKSALDKEAAGVANRAMQIVYTGASVLAILNAARIINYTYIDPAAQTEQRTVDDIAGVAIHAAGTVVEAVVNKGEQYSQTACDTTRSVVGVGWMYWKFA